MNCSRCDDPATHKCTGCNRVYCMTHANEHNEGTRKYNTGSCVAFQSANAVKPQTETTTEGSANT